MASLGSFKVETQEVTFTPSGGDSNTITFFNVYSVTPKVTATCLLENVNVYVADISTTQATISISSDLTTNIVTHVHIIGN